MCVFAYVCACVCVRAVRECVCIHSCVCACDLASQTEGKIRLGKPAMFLWQRCIRGMSSTCT